MYFYNVQAPREGAYTQRLNWFRHRSRFRGFIICKSINFMDNSETVQMCIAAPSGVCDHAHTFLVYVLAQPTAFRRRDVIRRTWGNILHYNSSCVQHGFNIQVIFAMGLSSNMSRSGRDKLSQEVVKHRDIWIGRFEDTYGNLVLKGIRILSWIKDTYPGDKIDFVMKIDEDVFPNLYPILRIAWRIRLRKNEITWPHFICHNKSSSPVVRDPNARLGKYSVSFEEYPEEYYPQYCSWGLYIMSREGMSLVVQGTTITKPFRMEDVYLTGIAPLAVQSDIRFVRLRFRTFSGRMRKRPSLMFQYMHELPLQIYELVLLQFAAMHCGQS